MRARVTNLLHLSRVSNIKLDVKLQNLPWTLNSTRRLHSDGPSVAPAMIKAVPVEEPGPHLEDLHGRKHDYLRISLTERCNLRCQYCMPAEGVPLSARSSLLTRDEVVRVTRALAARGVRKVRLTGGEPTLRRDLINIIEDISAIPGIRSVGMTTNGLVLTRRLPALQRAGLTAINVSLDSLRPQRYEEMARRPGLTRVLAGIDLALQLGYRPVKINTVLMKGFNDDEICDFVEYTREREVEVRFIEFMPFSGNAWDDSKLVPYRTALKTLTARYPDVLPALPRPNDTARVWQVAGHAGRVGFISSMTKNFCSTCNRLRLTADGNLKVCLFGSSEVSLRDAMRAGADDAQLEALVRAALRNKLPKHADGTFAAARARAVPLTPGALGLLASAARHMPRAAARAYCTRGGTALTHLDGEGHARMVDVGDKQVTARAAEAECFLRVSARLLRLLRDARLPKGDALAVARVAGIAGAKRTADLIPLCHPLPLDAVSVTVELPCGECERGGDVTVRCAVRATARTGAEMEALTGAAVAALALYDMCKSVDKGMQVWGLRVLRKSGGRGGSWPKEEEPPAPALRPLDTSPIRRDETYVPQNLMHF